MIAWGYAGDIHGFKTNQCTVQLPHGAGFYYDKDDVTTEQIVRFIKCK